VLSRRDVAGLVVTRVGRVASTADPVMPWVVLDGAGTPVEPVVQFLRDLLACGSSPSSCRSYGFDLLRWFLAAVDVEWHRAQRGEVRDFVLWLGMCHNPARDRHRPDAPAQGAVNSRTGKTSLRAGYAPATINHAVSVMSAFYDFHLLSGQGPVVSPVPPQSRDGRRLQGHHNPLEPFRLHRSLIPGPQI
jgi:integrase/recombinase XerC